MESQPDDIAQGSSDYLLDDQVGFLLRLANQRHTGIFAQHMADGLTPTQFAALMKLAEQGECSQNELGRRISMDVATIKGVVDRLRSKGLVLLRADPADRRRTMLSLSKEGLALVDGLRRAGAKISAATLAPLSQTEAKTFLKLLRKIGCE